MSKEKVGKEKSGKKTPLKNLKEKRAAKAEKRKEKGKTQYTIIQNRLLQSCITTFFVKIFKNKYSPYLAD